MVTVSTNIKKVRHFMLDYRCYLMHYITVFGPIILSEIFIMKTGKKIGENMLG